MPRYTEVSSADDVIDLRDVTARVEALEDELMDGANAPEDESERAEWFKAIADDDAHTLQDAARELCQLKELLSELRGYGGDHQWRGAWYPGSMIRDSYFCEYAEQLADDIGAINREVSWPCNCIDWDEAARQLQQDYSTVEFDGVTYWYR